MEDIIGLKQIAAKTLATYTAPVRVLSNKPFIFFVIVQLNKDKIQQPIVSTPHLA